MAEDENVQPEPDPMNESTDAPAPEPEPEPDPMNWDTRGGDSTRVRTQGVESLGKQRSDGLTRRSGR
jgi:hypothetical protein